MMTPTTVKVGLRATRAANVIRWLTLILLVATSVALACISPKRAAQLVLDHPDSAFAQAYNGHDHGSSALAYRMPDGVVRCENGMADAFPCANVDLLGHLDLQALGGGSGSDSWGWADPETGREYALVGRSTGVTFVDVTEPTRMRVVGTLPRNDLATVWADLKVFNDHAFIVADDVGMVGMQVFDLRRLRTTIGVEEVIQFEPDRVYREFASAHNIVINEETGFAYAVGGESCSTGAHAIDINDPLNPQFAGCLPWPSFIHDMQCVVYQGPDAEHAGKEICIANTGISLAIFDVDNKQDMRQLGSTTYPGLSFSHQGWLTSDQRHFVMGDETDESQFGFNTRTIVIDVQDLDAPESSGEYFAATRSIDHNQYVKGSLIYQANYSAGLRILRIDDAASAELTEVAYFDTMPENNSPSFNGAWNVYPFLPSGNILISDFSRGLFIVRSTLDSNGEPVDFSFDVLDGQWVTDDPDFEGARQGITIDYLPNFDQVFVAWFTYKATPMLPDELPADEISSADNRWLTAQLQISGQAANGGIFASSGGGFDAPANPNQRTEQVGTMSLEVIACDRLRLEYQLDEPDRSRSMELIPLEKRLDPNGFQCRQTSSPPAPEPVGVRDAGFGVL